MAVAAAAALTASACGGSDGESGTQTSAPADPPSASSPAPETPTATATPTPSPTPTPTPAVFDPAAALADIEHLAGSIGPREGTSPAFHQAASFVVDRFTALGYQVSTDPFEVPAGNSWGVPVDAGTSTNVIADSPGFDPAQPHVVVGAHLDTVPQAPGAEDNASGVAVVLELARLAAAQPPGVPVRFIAFGAEEPRGEGDDLHHFGSQHYVRELPAAQAAALAGMVSLDRVGVPADHVPVCTGGRGTTALRDALVAAAGTVDVPVQTCENRASDHWSFEKVDLPSARLGSIPYDGYHSPGDVPAVVDPAQLDRAGRIVWAWLSTL
ncbi:M28 family metallopeptidase [Jiangella gansuensis]|uniref:M28 family metallopeptidase n=1 Tax=Jiangella gansuensis TaxID=281473 RepID=UPI0004B2A35B|nr:M28 family peptidase [Jiangella gansuensis]